MQTGKLYSGTYGYPLRIRLSTSLVDASELTISFHKGTQMVTRSLDLESITDALRGDITCTLEAGDIPTAGTYEITLVIDKPGNRRLTAKSPLVVG